MTEEEIKAMQEENAKFKADVETLTAETGSMRTKMDDLLGEAKKAKLDRKTAEEATRLANEEKAKQDGDFEQMFKSSEESRSALQADYEDLKGTVATEKRNTAANRIAASLAEGDNAELLSSFIAPRLKYTDEGVKVLDNMGQVTVSTVDDLTQEFKNTARYSALLKGNQSSGGGANGGEKSGGAAPKTINRADWDNLNAMQRSDYMKTGGKVTSN